MATISEKLNEIKTAKENIKSSIEAKGVTVGDVSISEYYTAIDKIETIGYEWSDYDPVNIVDVLDKDTEPYNYKILLLMLNKGNNTYTIKASDRFYEAGDVIRGSDGGELTVTSSSQTYTFDESKDFINNLGQRVRYFIIYKTEKRYIGGTGTLRDDVLLYYFKNCLINDNRDLFDQSNGVAKTFFFDKDCNMSISNQNIATNSQTLVKYEMPDNTSVSNKSFYYAFAGCSSLKKAKLNLNFEVNNLTQCHNNNYALEDLLIINCPEEDVTCTSLVGYCYSLKNFVAKPYLRPANISSLFASFSGLEKISGIDFQSITNAWTLSNKSLVTIENFININTNFGVGNCHCLTHQSIMNIINALVDLTGQTAKTLTLGAVNLAKITDEEKAIAISKNWNLG